MDYNKVNRVAVMAAILDEELDGLEWKDNGTAELETLLHNLAVLRQRINDTWVEMVGFEPDDFDEAESDAAYASLKQHLQATAPKGVESIKVLP